MIDQHLLAGHRHVVTGEYRHFLSGIAFESISKGPAAICQEHLHIACGEEVLHIDLSAEQIVGGGRGGFL